MRLITLTHSIVLAATLLASASLQAQTNHRGESFPQQNLPRHGRSDARSTEEAYARNRRIELKLTSR